MKANVGNKDRLIRSIIGVALVALIYSEIIYGPFSWVIGVLAIIFIATSLTGICPLYNLSGTNTITEK